MILILVSFQIRLYARPDAIASGAGDYALLITRRLLGFYQDYFQVPYSLPKLGKALPAGGRCCPPLTGCWSHVTLLAGSAPYDHIWCFLSVSRLRLRLLPLGS